MEARYGALRLLQRSVFLKSRVHRIRNSRQYKAVRDKVHGILREFRRWRKDLRGFMLKMIRLNQQMRKDNRGYLFYTFYFYSKLIFELNSFSLFS